MTTPGMKSKTNLDTGTTSTAKKVLKAGDICKIIKTCKDSGIEEFSYNGLNLKFQTRRNEPAVTTSQSPEYQEILSESKSETSKETQLGLSNEEELFDEAQDAQEMIDDPLGFERSQIRRDVERNRLLNG